MRKRKNRDSENVEGVREEDYMRQRRRRYKTDPLKMKSRWRGADANRGERDERYSFFTPSSCERWRWEFVGSVYFLKS